MVVIVLGRYPKSFLPSRSSVNSVALWLNNLPDFSSFTK